MPTEPIDFDALNTKFTHKCTHIFNKIPRQWQIDVGTGILGSIESNSAHNQLLIRKTGEGKSLVYLATGACIGGVTLCISPILSLGMDQTRKVLNHTPNITSVTSFHLDEMSSSHITQLQTSLPNLPQTSSIFLFSSPQCFRNRNAFRQFLLRNHYIRFVVVDEVHLFVQFGNTFREEFSQLKVLLFDVIVESPSVIPSIFMTATCTQPMIDDIAQLTGIAINHRHWPSPAEMSHRNVSIEARYTKHHFRVLKSSICDALKPSPRRPDIRRKVIVYTNARSRAKDLSFKIGKFLDSTADDHIIDIVTLVGTMTKEEKAFYTNMFLNDVDDPHFKPDILCATSGVGNAGIDSSRIGVVYRLGMPESVQDLYQEKGRAGRYPDSLPIDNTYLLCFTIDDLIYLFRRSMNPNEMIINDEYRQRKVDDLLSMANVLASDQCMAVHIETLLGNPDHTNERSIPCGNCPVCRNEKLFFTINKEGTKAVLFDLFLFGDRALQEKVTLKAIVNAIKTYPRIREKIMSGSRSRLDMQPCEIKKLLFMLVAHGLLKLHCGDGDNGVVFQVAKSSNDDTVLAMQQDEYWTNMNSYVDLNN